MKLIFLQDPSFEDRLYNTDRYFDPEWLGIIDREQGDLISSHIFEKNKDWLEYLPNEENLRDSHYR